jgi:vacuolar protein sorting-associated protein IST1
MLTAKYGKPYADASRAAVHPANVSDKLQHKMSIQAPPKLLVEKYLIEIAKIYNIDYEPDQSIMQSGTRPEGFLIDFNNDKNNLDGKIPTPPGAGFAAYPQPPPLPIMPQPPANIPFNYPPQVPFNYPGPSNNNFPGQGPNNYPNYPGPSNNNNSGNGGMPVFSNSVPSAPFSYNYNIPPNPSSQEPEKKDLNVNFLGVSN